MQRSVIDPLLCVSGVCLARHWPHHRVEVASHRDRPSTSLGFNPESVRALPAMRAGSSKNTAKFHSPGPNRTAASEGKSKQLIHPIYLLGLGWTKPSNSSRSPSASIGTSPGDGNPRRGSVLKQLCWQAGSLFSSLFSRFPPFRHRPKKTGNSASIQAPQESLLSSAPSRSPQRPAQMMCGLQHQGPRKHGEQKLAPRTEAELRQIRSLVRARFPQYPVHAEGLTDCSCHFFRTRRFVNSFFGKEPKRRRGSPVLSCRGP